MCSPCPWLPAVEHPLDFTHTRRHGGEKGAAFYRDALAFGQSQWMAGKPAQAILQLNKAWMADFAVDDPILKIHPPPYRALAWMLKQAAAGHPGFFGNPVRHFQHLASRMSGPRAAIRSWRAWACLHLAEKILPAQPRDGDQLCREGLWIPSFPRAVHEITRLGWAGESEEICRALTL